METSSGRRHSGSPCRDWVLFEFPISRDLRCLESRPNITQVLLNWGLKAFLKLPDVETLSLRCWRPSAGDGRTGLWATAGSGPAGGRSLRSARSRQRARAAAAEEDCAPKPQKRPSPSGRAPRAGQEPLSPGPGPAGSAGVSQLDPNSGPAGVGKSASKPSKSLMAKLRRREPVRGQPGARALLLERPSESPSRPGMLLRSLGQAPGEES